MSSYRPGRALLAPLIAFGFAAVLTAAVAHAQNLDEGKPPAKLFVDGCASCHRSPRGLAKGRFSFTLYWFLKDHYATSADSAKALAAYLVSVDSGPRVAAKASKPAARSSHAPRPPAPVTGR